MSTDPTPETPSVRFLGRYALHDELASGGMATIHLGRLLGPVGFARTVAIKRLHAQYARDPHFVAMFLDEARLAARIRHQNVVPTLDVVALDREILLVMEYVHGESLSRLLATVAGRGESIPPRIAVSIVLGILHGLHAAHEAKSERGVALDIVHRDVSPQNVLVGVDGLARLVDFGVAKAAVRLQTTEDGDLKGKMAYMAPEQLLEQPVDRRTDIWAASVVFWEMLTGRRLFPGNSAAALVNAVLTHEVEPPSHVAGSPPELDAVVMRGLARSVDARFQTAREMALAVEGAHGAATASEISAWVEATAGEALRARATRVEEMESEGGGQRSSDGSLRKQLAALGFEAATRVGVARRAPPPPTSEAPTGAAPGRVRQSDAPPAPHDEDVVVPAPPARHGEDVAMPATSAPARRRWTLVLAAAAAIALAAIAALASRPVPATPADAQVTPTREVGAESAVTSAVVAPPSAAPPSPPIEPPPAAEIDASEVHHTVSPPLLVHPKTGASDAGRTAPGPKPDCDPPYTVGPPPDFIRRPKLECLPP